MPASAATSEKLFAAGPSISELEVATVLDAMRNGWYEHAYDYVEKFQREFAAFHGRAFALMTPSCTTAIHLLLAGLGIADGDEVIVPECTWIGSTAGITHQRATPVFCDIERDNWCLDPASVERAITPRTKAIIAVGLYGNMPRLERLQEIADRHGLVLIEDAAEAIGSVYKGRKAGSFGIASTFSFHRTKTITTGEGGMLLTDDATLFERCSFLRDHGRKPGGPAYYNYEVTFKYMPFNLQAALGWAQLQRIEELVAIKRHQLEFYRAQLADLKGLQLNLEPPGGRNGAWITGLVFDASLRISKATAMSSLIEQGIPARPFFYPLSSLPAYGSRELPMRERNPVAYDISARAINLPGAMNLTDEQLRRTCECVRGLVR